MVKFSFDIDADEFMTLMMEAVETINPDDLAYLFATGKSELEIRNQIALYLHRNRQDSQVISREWNRHDLAVLEQGKPRILVEGKSWVHTNAAESKKLVDGDKSILHALKTDISKLKKTQEQFNSVSMFITIVLFTVDVHGQSKDRLQNAHIKYASTHARGIKNHKDAEELEGRGRGALSQLLAEYGIVKRQPLKVGQYLDFRVSADFFLLQLIPRN
jgi:hypothetical protein